MVSSISFTKGDKITVKAFPNQILERRVVSVINDRTVAVCNDDEFKAALKEGREPTVIGFPITDVIMNDDERSTKKRT